MRTAKFAQPDGGRERKAFTDLKKREGKRFYSFLHSFDQSRIDQDGAVVIKDMTDHPRNSPKYPPTLRNTNNMNIIIYWTFIQLIRK